MTSSRHNFAWRVFWRHLHRLIHSTLIGIGSAAIGGAFRVAGCVELGVSLSTAREPLRIQRRLVVDAHSCFCIVLLWLPRPSAAHRPSLCTLFIGPLRKGCQRGTYPYRRLSHHLLARRENAGLHVLRRRCPARREHASVFADA